MASPTAHAQATRHVARDYSYVLTELRRVAVVVLFIIGGLIGTAAALRWF
jgi:hypothetical protein